MTGKLRSAMVFVAAAALAGACGGSSSQQATTTPTTTGSTSASELAPIHGTYAPRIDPSNFVSPIDNPYFPLIPGTGFHYKGVAENGTTPQTDDMVVTSKAKTILGVPCTVVRDTVSSRGKPIEHTFDWYAQDKDGNVWYMGEDTAEYENGVVVSTSGAWESGVSAALPGVIMLASPRVGDVYRQEYLPGEAEDLASVVSLDETVTVPAGTFTGCLKTRERSALDPDVDEFKYYCPGIGNVLVEEEDVREELIEYSGL